LQLVLENKRNKMKIIIYFITNNILKKLNKVIVISPGEQ
jgi:hypothetical protein